MKEEKEGLFINVKRLVDAIPGNDKIPERMRSIREDNRRSYAQKISALAESFEIPGKVSEVPEFCSRYDKAMEEFGSSTLRNYRILKDFFGNEVDTLATNLRNVDNEVKKARKVVEDSPLKGIESTERSFLEVQGKIRRRETITQEISASEEELKKMRESKSECELRIKQIEESREYQALADLIQYGKNLDVEAGNKEREILHSFSVIETALKKYERMTLEDDLVRGYLNNPLDALMEDSELKIVEIVGKMKNSILSGELGLKDSKKVKVLAGLDEIREERLSSFIKDFNGLRERMREAKLKIKEAEIGEIGELRKKLAGIEVKTGECGKRLSGLKEELASIDIGKLKESLSVFIREKTGERVTVA